MASQENRIKAADLVRLFRQVREEGWGYIWGKRGQIWTQANQDAATRAQTVQYGQKWVGKRVSDCSGLFAWAFKELGGSIYHGSNTIWKKYCSSQGKITPGMSLRPGTAVFQESNGNRYHIGLYAGNNVVIEARGTNSGVVESSPSDWDEWGELKDVDYSDADGEVLVTPRKTLQSGSRGALVRTLQETLNALGYQAGTVDGVFGPNTRAAVLSFQQAAKLDADGIVGPKTWAALDQAETAEMPTQYTVVIPGLTAAEAAALMNQYPEAKQIAEEGEGLNG